MIQLPKLNIILFTHILICLNVIACGSPNHSPFGSFTLAEVDGNMLPHNLGENQISSGSIELQESGRFQSGTVIDGVSNPVQGEWEMLSSTDEGTQISLSNGDFPRVRGWISHGVLTLYVDIGVICGYWRICRK